MSGGLGGVGPARGVDRREVEAVYGPDKPGRTDAGGETAEPEAVAGYDTARMAVSKGVQQAALIARLMEAEDFDQVGGKDQEAILNAFARAWVRPGMDVTPREAGKRGENGPVAGETSFRGPVRFWDEFVAHRGGGRPAVWRRPFGGPTDTEGTFPRRRRGARARA